MAITNTASAHWSGDLKSGTGQISTRSATLTNAPYDFRKRFEGAPGTNPEELIAAAHAACFTMALSAELGKSGMVADAIDTTATSSMEMISGVPTLTKVHLDLTARIPGMTDAAFQTVAASAKSGCVISRALNAEVTLTATLA